MKTIRIFCTLLCACMLAVAATGCVRQQEDMPSDSGTAAALVTFDLTVESTTGELPGMTRIVDGKPDDFNIYIYNEAVDFYHHGYYTRTRPMPKLFMPYGQYKIFVVGNTGRDLGDCSLSQIGGLSLNVSSVNDFPPAGREYAAGFRELVVDRETTSFSLALRRTFSKITLGISLDGALGSDAHIVSVIPYNMPAQVSLFEDSALRTSGKTIAYPYKEVTGNKKSYSFTYYQFENMQGDNYSISSALQRNERNAPTGASYAAIRVQSGDAYYDYRVYLGNNATTNFDVSRNAVYNLDVRILGKNTSDLRVSKTEMIFWFGHKEYLYKNAFEWKDGVAYGQLQIACINPDPDNVISLSFRRGMGTFKSKWTMEYYGLYTGNKYTRLSEGVPVKVFEGIGTRQIYFRFTNSDGTTNYETTNNTFVFTVTDSSGFSRDFSITTNPNNKTQ